MTILDDSLIPGVQDLLDELGKAATLRHVTASTYNPTTGAASKTTTDEAVKITPPSGYPAGMIDGDLVRHGDVKCLVAAQDLTNIPAEDDRVVYDSQTFGIVTVAPIYSGEQVCAYKLQLRR